MFQNYRSLKSEDLCRSAWDAHDSSVNIYFSGFTYNFQLSVVLTYTGLSNSTITFAFQLFIVRLFYV